MNKDFKILVINPGSTSTKMAVYLNEVPEYSVSIPHSREEISRFPTVWDQYSYRKGAILNELESQGYHVADMDIIVCRGGNTAPVEGGIYEITPGALEIMKSGKYGSHPAGVGNLISYELGREYGMPVITCDPPITDEFCDYARYTGLPELTRLSSFHALNQKATARKVTASLGKTYSDSRMVVVHMGGGISVGAHLNGRVIDVNNALDGDGPYSPERAGTLPNADLVRMCYSGKYSEAEMLKKMTGKGGLVAYLGTSDGLLIEKIIDEGNVEAKNVYMAMAYQTVKEIGAMAAVLDGRVDAIALTGSLAYSEILMDYIKDKVSFIAPIYVIPGENEMDALASGAVRYLTGEEQPRKYNY